MRAMIHFINFSFSLTVDLTTIMYLVLVLVKTKTTLTCTHFSSIHFIQIFVHPRFSEYSIIFKSNRKYRDLPKKGVVTKL